MDEATGRDTDAGTAFIVGNLAICHRATVWLDRRTLRAIQHRIATSGCVPHAVHASDGGGRAFDVHVAVSWVNVLAVICRDIVFDDPAGNLRF